VIREKLAGFRLAILKKTNRVENLYLLERIIFQLTLKVSGWGEGSVEWITLATVKLASYCA